MNMVIEPYIFPVRDHQTKLQQMLHTSKQAEDLRPKSVIPLFHLFAKHPSSKFKIITSELVLYLHCFLNKIVKFFVGEFRQRLFIVIQRTTNIHIGHRHLNFLSVATTRRYHGKHTAHATEAGSVHGHGIEAERF